MLFIVFVHLFSNRKVLKFNVTKNNKIKTHIKTTPCDLEHKIIKHK